MSADEIEILQSNDWKMAIKIIEKYWNTNYGTFEICKEPGMQTLELTTGGWIENESFINKISDTVFWFFWWQESKRGGYYKFIYREVMAESNK